jgi:hypothetical protein
MVEERQEKYKQLIAKDYTEEEFREMWRSHYCRRAIFTFDGIRVRFYDSNFDHAFYESSDRRQANKDMLSRRRLSRILWIKDALEDPEAEIHVGYLSKSLFQSGKRRVTLVKGNYVVVIQLYKDNEANFITAFVGDEEKIKKVKSDPLWPSIKKDAD